jgi:beta-xylosidase
VVESSRLGIPAIVHEECLTGFTTYQATVYPTALAWAATFDPDLVHEMASAIGRDMAAVGVHQGCRQCLTWSATTAGDGSRKPWARIPTWCPSSAPRTSAAWKTTGIIATLKHFAGYSASKAARNHAPVSRGPRELAEYILPPFEHALRVGRVRSVMNSYTDIDGIPGASDPRLLTEVLRDAWSFTGTVVSDYGAVTFLQLMHRIAGTEGEAAAYALAARLDIELPSTVCYAEPLQAEIEAGRVDEALWIEPCGGYWRRSWSLACSMPAGHRNRWTMALTLIPLGTVTSLAVVPSPALCCWTTRPVCCRCKRRS